MEAPFRAHNRIEWVDDKVVCRTGPEHANVNGGVHGGVMSSMLDAVMGGNAILALGNGRTVVTSSLTVNFLAGAEVGDELVATAQIRRLGRTLAYVDGDCRRSSDDVLIATASGVFAIINRS